MLKVRALVESNGVVSPELWSSAFYNFGSPGSSGTFTIQRLKDEGLTPEQIGKSVIGCFNDSLRAGEIARKFISADWSYSEAGDETTTTMCHSWRKTSLVTEQGGYDRMRCSQCGITGKRYGLGQTGVMRDNKFKHKRFECCRLSQEYLQAKQARQVDKRRKTAQTTEIRFGRSE